MAVNEFIRAQRARDNLQRTRQTQVMSEGQTSDVLKAEITKKEELEQKYNQLLDKSDVSKMSTFNFFF